MTLINKTAAYILLLGSMFTGFQSCQKMERPPFATLIPDPTPPPYTPLKSFWAFEDNTTDAGENAFTAVTSGVSFVPGITGKGFQPDYAGSGGYIMINEKDTLVAPNEFVSVPFDTLKNIGSFTFAFWMNGEGPVQNGAQGVISVSNNTEFWGNFDIFLENYSNAADPSEVFLKIHMFNAGVASGNGEEWNEIKIPGVLNRWTHIAVTYNAATSKLSVFKDGAATGIYNKTLGGGNYGRIKWNNISGIAIGNHAFQTSPSLTNHGPEGWAKPIKGAMDQVRIYNQALSESEILNLFTNKL